MKNMLISLIAGVVSGIISGFFVYHITKEQEEKLQVYYFWQNFILKSLEKAQLYIPNEALHYISVVDSHDGRWRNAIYKLLDANNPCGHEDVELTDEEEQIATSAIIALEELDKWKDKNHLDYFIKSNRQKSS